MANWTNFEDWEFVAQSGNFLIKSFEDDELRYFAVKSAAGHWAQVYRNDHPIFHVIESFLNTEDEKMGDVLDLLCTLNYTMTSLAPDQQFVDEFMTSVVALAKRQEEFEAERQTKTDEEVLAEDLEAEEAAENAEMMLEEGLGGFGDEDNG